MPKGGANIAGRFVPEGTIVSVAQFPTNHSARNFSNPFSFQPDRFLQPEKYPDDKPGAIQPFGIGPRDCIGKKWVLSLFGLLHGCLELLSSSVNYYLMYYLLTYLAVLRMPR